MFEQKLKRLEEIVQKMESSELDIDSSLKLFEEGVRLTKECHSNLNEAEQKVKILLGVNENGTPRTEPFATAED